MKNNQKYFSPCSVKVVKTMQADEEQRIAELIIEELKKSQCTLTNFNGISQVVHQFFNDNATLDN